MVHTVLREENRLSRAEATSGAAVSTWPYNKNYVS